MVISWSVICYGIAAVLFFLLGLNLINSTGETDLVLIAFGFVVSGFALGGVPFPVIGRRE